MPASALAGLAVGIAVVSIGIYHAAFVSPRLRRLDATLRGEGIDATADGGESLPVVRAAAAAFARRTDERLGVLEAALARDLLHVGFVRYNSFSDVGSDQSFTLALLNAAGDGVLISSIFGREETRTYGKSVRNFTPQQGASKEEQTAISMARSGQRAFALS